MRGFNPTECLLGLLCNFTHHPGLAGLAGVIQACELERKPRLPRKPRDRRRWEWIQRPRPAMPKTLGTFERFEEALVHLCFRPSLPAKITRHYEGSIGHKSHVVRRNIRPRPIYPISSPRWAVVIRLLKVNLRISNLNQVRGRERSQVFFFFFCSCQYCFHSLYLIFPTGCHCLSYNLQISNLFLSTW